MRKKKKQKKSLHPPGGEVLSAMQVPSDLAFGEPVVTFYGGREVQIDCSLWERESGLFRIPGRRCGWKGESIR